MNIKAFGEGRGNGSVEDLIRSYKHERKNSGAGGGYEDASRIDKARELREKILEKLNEEGRYVRELEESKEKIEREYNTVREKRVLLEQC